MRRRRPEEAFVARPFLAASSGFDGVLFCRGLLGGGEFGLLRAPPALHRFTEDGGALGLGKDARLPGGGAGPAFFDLAEITADMVPIPAQQRGDFAGGMALKKERSISARQEFLSAAGDFSLSFSSVMVSSCFLGELMDYPAAETGQRGPRRDPGRIQNGPTTKPGRTQEYVL